MNPARNGKSKFRVVIPARLGSRRLPNKPLLKLAGRPLIEHVYRNAVSSGAEQVIVATDAVQLVDCVRAFGGHAHLTGRNHATGTDRVAAVVEALAWEDECVVVNLQSDEPFITAADIQCVVAGLVASSAAVATLALPLDEENARDDNIVKVVRSQEKSALYFSRAPIPYPHDPQARECYDDARADTSPYCQHLGIYACHCDYLRRFAALPRTLPELVESLEQLRSLMHGDRIHVADARSKNSFGINCEKDLQNAIKLLQ